MIQMKSRYPGVTVLGLEDQEELRMVVGGRRRDGFGRSATHRRHVAYCEGELAL